jgi:hypothetical protein
LFRWFAFSFTTLATGMVLAISLAGCQKASEKPDDDKADKHKPLEKAKYPYGIPIVVRSIKPPNAAKHSGRPARVLVYGLTNEDFESFMAFPTVVESVPSRHFPQEIWVRDKKYSGRLLATVPTYAKIHGLELAAGRFFTKKENEDMVNRVVLGNTVAGKLFPSEDPIGKSISLGKNLDKFQVVGVLGPCAAKKDDGVLGDKQVDESAFIPISTARRWYGKRIVDRKTGAFTVETIELHQVILIVANADKVRKTAQAIREVLSKSHSTKDWEVIVPKEFRGPSKKD